MKRIRLWWYNESSLRQILEWRGEPEFWLIVRLYLVAWLICPGIRIAQIKYKYGYFRFYLNLPMWMTSSRLRYLSRLFYLWGRYHKATEITENMIRKFQG